VDGEDAVRKFSAFDPDLVLLDINMPIKDGFQAATEMRTVESKRTGPRRAKIIAVTALSQEQSKRRGMLECGIGTSSYWVVEVTELIS
jgi:CheY-like chemotaxis protein